MQPFSERDIRFRGLTHWPGWTLKVYSVLYGMGGIRWDGFEEALALARDALPAPDPAAGRPGLGFFIAHQGRTGDYAVLGWWDHENELPLKIWVRRAPSDPWRPSAEGESVCVWDLEILWEEREAWVRTMLTPQGTDAGAYLAHVPSRFAGGNAEGA